MIKAELRNIIILESMIVNYEGPGKVNSNVVVVTAPSVIEIKTNEIWDRKEPARRSEIFHILGSDFT